MYIHVHVSNVDRIVILCINDSTYMYTANETFKGTSYQNSALHTDESQSKELCKLYSQVSELYGYMLFLERTIDIYAYMFTHILVHFGYSMLTFRLGTQLHCIIL